MNINLSEIPMDMILNLLNIVILFLIVHFLVYKPVKNFMQKRTDAITAAQEEAKAAALEAEKTKESYLLQQKQAQEDSVKLLAEQTARAEETAREILQKANEQKKQLLEDAEKRAQTAYDKKLEAAQEDMVDMACRISGVILSREMNDGDCRRIAEDFFKEDANA